MDVIWLQCVCVCVCVCVCARACTFLCERLACRGGWSGLENILCDSTSGLASLSSDIPLSLPHCNSSTVHSLCFVQVPVSEGDDVTAHELCEFRGLPKGGLERFSVCTKKRVGTHIQVRCSSGSIEVYVSFFYDSGWRGKNSWLHKIIFILWWNYCRKVAMISRMLIAKSNNAKSTDIVVDDNWAAYHYAFMMAKCILR